MIVKKYALAALVAIGLVLGGAAFPALAQDARQSISAESVIEAIKQRGGHQNRSVYIYSVVNARHKWRTGRF